MLNRLGTIIFTLAFVAACGDAGAPSGETAESEDSLAASHHWECTCTCEVTGNGDETVSWDCPECRAEGNQCRASEGSACQTSRGETGVLQSCSEILVPNPLPTPKPADSAAVLGR